MLAEKIKQSVLDFNTHGLHFFFNYGEEHWQNLLDLEADYDKVFSQRTKCVLLRYVNKKRILNDFGSVERILYTGEMNLVVRSKFDDKDYNAKYENNIKHLSVDAERLLNSFDECDDEWIVKSWEELEIENVYDTNFDGLKIKFSVEVNAQ